MISVEPLRGSSEGVLGDIIPIETQQSFWTSDWFRLALANTLVNAREEYLVVSRAGDLWAFVPAFRTNGGYGTVVNSLPFFGSHGGTYIHPKLGSGDKLKLLEGLESYWRDTGVARVVLIEPLLKPDLIAVVPASRVVATRVSNLSPIHHQVDPEEDGAVIKAMHPKQRNAYRKGARFLAELEVSWASDADSILSIWEEHRTSSLAQSRPHKPLAFFDHFMQRADDPENPIRAFVARTKGGDFVAGLILFQFGSTVEYFTPVVVEAWRSKQILSALIVRAMNDLSAESHARWWNWGGTWGTQDSLARFKARWGGHSTRYQYWALDTGDCRALDTLPRGELESLYPYFFVRPFQETQTDGIPL